MQEHRTKWSLFDAYELMLKEMKMEWLELPRKQLTVCWIPLPEEVGQTVWGSSWRISTTSLGQWKVAIQFMYGVQVYLFATDIPLLATSEDVTVMDLLALEATRSSFALDEKKRYLIAGSHSIYRWGQRCWLDVIKASTATWSARIKISSIAREKLATKKVHVLTYSLENEVVRDRR